MRYIANPVVVDAFKITQVEWTPVEGQPDVPNYTLTLEDGRVVTAGPEMVSRMSPAEGDYWVVQADGYTYLNPRAVFERKYSIDPGHAARVHKVPIGEPGSGLMA